ncbi:hypothetical protein RA279_27720, partial [Pseudomonas syringae pv. tagetis]|uniref:hypothetical protein n=1 Tax=Pseudomonas syringae group genomosp. 7 TaxID=251699 RepID=UPI00377062C7
VWGCVVVVGGGCLCGFVVVCVGVVLCWVGFGVFVCCWCVCCLLLCGLLSCAFFFLVCWWFWLVFCCYG